MEMTWNIYILFCVFNCAYVASGTFFQSNTYPPNYEVPSVPITYESSQIVDNPKPRIPQFITSIPSNQNEQRVRRTMTNGQEILYSPTETFCAALWNAIALPFLKQNIVYSPISIQMLLANLYILSNELTALELQMALKIPFDKTEVVKLFHYIGSLEALQPSGINDLIIANKLYYSDLLSIYPNSKEISKYFNTEIESISFSNPNLATQMINKWVKKKTRKHISNLVGPYTLKPQTLLVLLSAIYFKGLWENPFSLHETKPRNFTNLYQSSPKTVDTMYIMKEFPYGDFPSLQARIIELPYKNLNTRMMIILPYENDGLASVESQLSHVLLNDISRQLKMQTVTVELPRFKIEFNVDLIQPLKQLNIQQLFTPQANLSELFQNSISPPIDKFEQKAYINVNEAGSEAAAASFARVVLLSAGKSNSITFQVNHPFIFVIRDSEANYFVGHVVNL